MNEQMQRYLVCLLTAIGEHRKSGLFPGLLNALDALHHSVEGSREPDPAKLLRWAEEHAAGTVAEPIAAFLANVAEMTCIPS